MNLEAFCYLGWLTFPEQAERSLSLLPEAARADAIQLFSTVKALPRNEVVQRWSKLREDEFVALGKQVSDRSGVSPNDIPPALREYWIAYVCDHQ